MTHFPKLLLLLLAVATFAIGCSDTKPAEQPKAVQQTKPAEEIRTVEWWQQPENEAARQAKVAECLRMPNPEEARKDQNCVNAAIANTFGTIGSGFEPVRQPTFHWLEQPAGSK